MIAFGNPVTSPKSQMTGYEKLSPKVLKCNVTTPTSHSLNHSKLAKKLGSILTYKNNKFVIKSWNPIIINNDE